MDRAVAVLPVVAGVALAAVAVVSVVDVVHRAAAVVVALAAVVARGEASAVVVVVSVVVASVVAVAALPEEEAGAVVVTSRYSLARALRLMGRRSRLGSGSFQCMNFPDDTVCGVYGSNGARCSSKQWKSSSEFLTLHSALYHDRETCVRLD